jgi:hypothetical protein
VNVDGKFITRCTKIDRQQMLRPIYRCLMLMMVDGLFFLTLLIWILCHMHHGYILTLMHMCMQIEREAPVKCVIGI